MELNLEYLGVCYLQTPQNLNVDKCVRCCNLTVTDNEQEQKFVSRHKFPNLSIEFSDHTVFNIKGSYIKYFNLFYFLLIKCAYMIRSNLKCFINYTYSIHL